MAAPAANQTSDKKNLASALKFLLVLYKTLDDSLSSVVSQQQVSGRLQHLVADQDVDPIRLLPVDVGDLLRGDAVEHGDLFTQVQQRRLLQVQSSVDCGGGRREKGKHQCGLQVHQYCFL